MQFFNLIHKDINSHARAGVIHTDHGDIETPMFMPVGTQATVKGLDSRDLAEIGAQVILGNTYHLHLRPGEDLIASQGGLHTFMNWPGPILTDSGGFQVFSLGLQKDVRETKNPTPCPSPNRGGLPAQAGIKGGVNNRAVEQLNNETNGKTDQGRLVEIDDDGVTFRSYIDGSEHRFTPEKATEIQHKLGADIIMAFDECTPDNAPEWYVREAMERTHRWAERSTKEHRHLQSVILNPERKRAGEESLSKSRNGQRSFADAQDDRPYRQFLFGIIQGSNYKHLREESARFISKLGFDGIAIGGESIGYNMEATKQILDWVHPLIPEDKPHYAMGIGLSPVDLLIAIEHGVDMFDCVAPTRLARHGMLFIKDKINNHRLNIKNARFKNDTGPLDTGCACAVCARYTRSYLHHLFDAGEITGLRLATIHNLHFLLNLMRETRQAILNDGFKEIIKEWI